MTLILGLGNLDQIILLADRRLTRIGDGTTIDSPETKLTYFVCQDAAVGVAFTGLATAGRLNTAQWLLDTLEEVDDGDIVLSSVVQRVRSRADRTFQRYRSPLTFLFMGWSHGVRVADGEEALICRTVLVGNTDAANRVQARFTVTEVAKPVRAHWDVPFVTLGATAGLRTAELEQLGQLLREDRPRGAYLR